MVLHLILVSKIVHSNVVEKVVVLGDESVGKTSLIMAFLVTFSLTVILLYAHTYV